MKRKINVIIFGLNVIAWLCMIANFQYCKKNTGVKGDSDTVNIKMTKANVPQTNDICREV